MGTTVQAVVNGHAQLVHGHYESFLMGTSRSKKINLKNLKPAGRKLINGTMDKEWSDRAQP